MRFSPRKVTPLAIATALIFSALTSITPAQALTVQSVNAPWAYTYAAPHASTAKSITKEPILNEKRAEAKATFIIKCLKIV